MKYGMIEAMSIRFIGSLQKSIFDGQAIARRRNSMQNQTMQIDSHCWEWGEFD